MRIEFPGTILAGGRSSRMGAPKALLPFGSAGRLIDHVAARLSPQVDGLLLNANSPDISLAGVARFADRFADFPGPLGGIHASLCHVAETMPEKTHVFLLPVDMPFFPQDLAQQLRSFLAGPEELVLTRSDGRLHPVTGLWPVSLAARLGRWLEAPPTLKVRAFLDGLPVRAVDFAPRPTATGPIDPFFNVNTPEDYRLALSLIAAEQP
jgi:molybdopterin-guanine dinucleotide biosynthesis protein A